MVKETVHVLLPPALIKTLKREAKRQGISFSEIVRRLVTRGVQNGEHKKA